MRYLKNKLRELFVKRETLVFIILTLIILLCGAFNRDFIRINNLLGILVSSLILIMLSVGETFVIITKGIDVSVGAIMGLSAVCMGMVANVNSEISYFVAILVGLSAGAINGFGISIIGIPPIIMTLGTMGLYRGLMPIITGGSWVDSVPQSIKIIAQIKVFNINLFIIIVFFIILISMLILRFFSITKSFYAVGGNEEGAFNLGISVRATKFFAYLISGFFASIAAIIFVSQLSFIPMNAGNGEEMRAIASSVLGGVSLSGGVGTPISSTIGAIFLTTINSVLIFLKVPSYWNDAIAGAILIAIVLSDYRVRKYLEYMRKRARFSSVRIKSKIEKISRSAK